MSKVDKIGNFGEVLTIRSFLKSIRQLMAVENQFAIDCETGRNLASLSLVEGTRSKFFCVRQDLCAQHKTACNISNEITINRDEEV